MSKKNKKKERPPFMVSFIRWLYPKLERSIPSLAQRYLFYLFLKPFRYRPSEKELKAERDATQHTFRAAGKNIRLYMWGKGDDYVLVLHGWSGRAAQFRAFIPPLLDAQLKIIGFDGPAHGRSTGTSTNILEFFEVIQYVVNKYGVPRAVIAHSFGGAAALYSASRGLRFRKLINIASPTIGDEIIKTFLEKVGASPESGQSIKALIRKKFGKEFDEFAAVNTAKGITHPLDLLLIHDEHDREVDLVHPQALLRVFPTGYLYRTKGLGHLRILKDDEVIRRCVTFIREPASFEITHVVQEAE